MHKKILELFSENKKGAVLPPTPGLSNNIESSALEGFVKWEKDEKIAVQLQKLRYFNKVGQDLQTDTLTIPRTHITCITKVSAGERIVASVLILFRCA